MNTWPIELQSWMTAQRMQNMYRASHFNVTQLHFLATDGYANHMRKTLDEMDEETFQLYLRYHFATCERIDMVGYSNHTLDIFRKD